MDYDRIFSNAIADIKDEGRYRVFMDIERTKGEFPKAEWHTENGIKEITQVCL